MKFLKNNMWTVLALALVLFVSFTGDSLAAGGTVMDTAREKAVNVFKSIKTIVFVLGGFGLVGLAVQAIFGKVKWSWFGALAVGLGVLAAAGAIVNYATGDTTVQTDYLGDSFGSSTQSNVR